MIKEYFTKILEELDEDTDNLDRLIMSLCTYDNYLDCDSEKLDELLKKYDYELIENCGGGEGGAEDCTSVFKFDGKLYRAYFNYYSHDGYNYEDIVSTLKEVFPVERMTTYYE